MLGIKENVPAFNKQILRENKDDIQIICVNNTQIFLKEIKINHLII